MKMAKASQADLDMAMELVCAFESLASRWVPAMPDAIEQLEDDQEHEGFDREDDAQCGRALRYLLDLTDRASLSRVVWGMAVVCDPANRLLDPDADTLEAHPDYTGALDHVEKLLKACRRVYDDVGPPGDFGYSTKPGKALKELYDQFNAALKARPAVTPPAEAGL